MSPVLLLLLLLAAPSALSQSCSSLQRRLINAPSDPPPPQFCVGAATRLRASVLRILANGSCLLHLPCSKSRSGGVGSLSVFQLVQRVPLVRGRADRRHNPYDLLMEGDANSTQVTSERLTRSSDAFKSPLVDEDPTPFARIHLSLRNEKGKEKASLTFRMTSGATLRNGKWFSLQNLLDAKPWNVAVLKNSNLNVFSMKGNTKSQRRFLIRKLSNNCDDLPGVLYVSGKKICDWEKPIGYYWAEKDGGPAQFAEAKSAAEFILFGEMDADLQRLYLTEE